MEFYKSKCGNYKIESISAPTVPGTFKVRVMKDAFCQDESVCIGCGINKNPKAADEVLDLCADAMLDNVSIVAVEIATGKVVAVAINKILLATPDTDEPQFFEIFSNQRCLQEETKSLVNFIIDADGRCNLFEMYAVDCSLEIMFLATLREHRGRSLATLLCKASIDLAIKLKDGPVAGITREDLGPKYVMLKSRKYSKYPKLCQALWTAEGSQNIGQKLNFVPAVRIPFSDYSFAGKTYAERIGGDPMLFCETGALKLF